MIRPLKLLTAAIATATLSLAAPRPAEAQFTNPYTFSTWNNPISSSADTAIMNRAFQRMIEGGSSGSASGSAPAPAAPAPLSASAFRPVAAQLMPRRLAADPALSPTEQQQMAALYSDLLTFYHDWLGQEGEQRLQNNVAGAMTYLLLTSHYMLNDGEELSEADQDAILQNFNEALANDAHFQTLSAQAKQELYETLVISAALPLALFFEGHEVGDPDSVAEAQAMVEAVLTAILSPS
ncbi:DUF6683 family protein [Nodosilinea sp. PGN35]|uniref:DUF6683 family protein n=1 Tax=Nodosilinea sp. PGN35 TaxID=3020489 RepID=UPI0023B31257|nr:DUF6683 family protein [Nodosilinea sp. TSF1-S3]MDF0368108.1 hypothetical protein [Nodosilinea sp. TSF1-S3]